MAITAKQVKEKFQRAGKTQRQWAIENGFRPQEVTRVLNGQSRALRGKGHEIAVLLGLKDQSAG
jgi:gp16 family phage-associated protein